MALDYSKLSDEELEALEKGDYSKLSDATLQALASEQQPQTKAPATVPGAPAEPYVTQAEADRNELLGAGAVGLGALGAGAAAYKYSPTIQAGKKVVDFIRNPVSQQVAEKVIDVAKNALTAPPTTPVAPTTSPILGPNGQPIVRAPVAPTAPATSGPLPQGMSAGPRPFTPPQTPGIVDRASMMIRELAASKVLPQLAKAGVGITAAIMPGNVGQNYPFPQSGPMRGQEINPGTGRPWTKQELDAYRAQYGG